MSEFGEMDPTGPVTGWHVPVLSQHKAIVYCCISTFLKFATPDVYEQYSYDGIGVPSDIEVHSDWRKWYLDRKY